MNDTTAASSPAPEPAGTATATVSDDAAGDRGVVLRVRDLMTHFRTSGGVARAVDGVSFDIRASETFALVGESGCGKSVTALSMMQLVPKPGGFHPQGSIELTLGGRTRDLLRMPEKEKRKIRGNDIAMIFQEPMTSLNPVFTVGEQIAEVVRLHEKLKPDAARKRAIEMLDLVRIPDPQQRVDEYPHQMSGGQKQRAMIAMALACKPSLLIADEPTTALDVTVQAQILELMRDLQREVGMSILLITHDLGVVAEVSDRVAVMYAGKIVETTDTKTLFARPRHPYSVKLFDSLPDVTRRGRELAAIPGMVPPATKFPDHCRFAGRCEHRFGPCEQRMPDLKLLPSAFTEGDSTSGHEVRCFAYDEAIEDEKPEVKRAEPEAREAAAAAGDEEHDHSLIEVNDLRVEFGVRVKQKQLAPEVGRIVIGSYIASIAMTAVMAVASMVDSGLLLLTGLWGVLFGCAVAGIVLQTSAHAARKPYAVAFHSATCIAAMLHLLLGAPLSGVAALALIGWAVALYRSVAAATVKLKAVDGIDLLLPRGKTIALVGESGCGKTTAGKAMLHLIQPAGGAVMRNGENVTEFFAGVRRLQDNLPLATMSALLALVGIVAALGNGGGAGVLFLILLLGVLFGVGTAQKLDGRLRLAAFGALLPLFGLQTYQGLAVAGDIGAFGDVVTALSAIGFGALAYTLYGGRGRGRLDARVADFRQNCQIIFQDPYGSLNPRQMVGEILAEGMAANGIGTGPDDREKLARELLEQCGLPGDAVARYPHEFSGGQRQRIGIARALAVNPSFIVCDEPTSALDVSVQAQILNLLGELREKRDLTYLFITHDLRTVEYLADEVCVMYLGRIVERGNTEDIFRDPKHPYTRALLEAIPETDPATGAARVVVSGDVPSPINPPPGCPFHRRCAHVMDVCRSVYPGVTPIDNTVGRHRVHCFRYGAGDATVSPDFCYQPAPLERYIPPRDRSE